MYDAVVDPYCYPGTTVLINRLEIRDPDELQAFEEEITRERAAEPLPAGRLSVNHFKSIHRHLFQDVYDWAGRIRTIRISKGESMFCYPENIHAQLRNLFDWLSEQQYLRERSLRDFSAGAAHFLAELNAIHAFRDGNGRTQLTFVALVAVGAGHPLRFEGLDPASFLDAMIASFQGNETPLSVQLEAMGSA